MDHKTYFKVTGIIFLVIALLHLWRIANGISVTFGGSVVPVIISWAAVIVAGYLAYQGLKKK